MMVHTISSLSMAICLLWATNLAAMQEISPYERASNEFQSKLSALKARCDQAGLTAEATETQQLIILRDPTRQYFFVPPDSNPWTEKKPSGQSFDWAAEFQELRSAQATTLLKLAQQMALEESGEQAFALLHEVCVYDPDHAAARKALGYRKIKGRWLNSATEITVRKPRTRHSALGWAADSYIIVDSPHYQIASTAANDDAIRLAENLERWRCIWRQAFYPFWSRDKQYRALLDGSDPPSLNRKHEVIFFADREQYVTKLTELGVVGVERSTGFYSDERRMALFYLDDPIPIETWLQEQAHQLFQESIATRTNPVETSHTWALEGVAMYFESLVEHPYYATLGGFDYSRLQYARVHWKREAFFVPFAELTQLGRAEFQGHADVSKLYSQSAGMAHFFMTAQQGRYRAGFLDLIDRIYQRRAKLDSLSELSQSSDAELESQYQSFLTVDPDIVKLHLSQPESRTELALGFSDVDSSIGPVLDRCPNLQWLQLSSTSVDDEIGPVLSRLSKLTQLFLDRTQITDRCLQDLETMTALEELDLADTAISDEGLASIGKLTNLKALWLSGTRVTDDGLTALTGLTHLQLLDVRRTEVTAEGMQNLKRHLPQLK